MLKYDYGFNNDRGRGGAYDTSWFSQGDHFFGSGTGFVAGYYPFGAQWMDLLGDRRQEGRDSGDPDREGAVENERRNAPPVLLGRLPPPLK